MAVNYEFMKRGLSMVEQEMPASISFHVPDQYHKRIIGIGGQHIQRIMKKHSVFVKFSNAMDRGGMSREDDDIKVDNVICRTPARNAQNLDAVKNEILEMVDRAVSVQAPLGWATPPCRTIGVYEHILMLGRIRSTHLRPLMLTGSIIVSSSLV